MEFVARADLATFLRGHWNSFGYFGGIPKRCLYDNAKVVVLGRDEAGEVSYQPEFLDFSLRLGFAFQLCRTYRAQTKGRVENGVKYVRATSGRRRDLWTWWTSTGRAASGWIRWRT